jgi:hypothetical protein
MLELSELDNEITKKQLNRTFPNKVDIKFGLDANKIKGVNNFPIYYESKGFTSHAKQNVDSFMFHTPHNTNKYNVAKPTHTPVGEIRPYLFDKQSPSQPKETNVRMKQGEMSSLYGLPPDKTIVLENPTAQAMGKITEEEFRVKQWQKDFDGTTGLPDGIENIINGGNDQSQHIPSGHGTASSVAMDVDTEPQVEPVKVTIKRKKTPVVAPAFELKPSLTVDINREEIEAEVEAETNTAVDPEIKDALKSFLLANPNRKREITKPDRDMLDELLKKFGFKTPQKSSKKISTYISAFRKIISIKKNIDIGESPLKKKRGPNKRKNKNYNIIEESPRKKPDNFNNDMFFEDETKNHK